MFSAADANCTGQKNGNVTPMAMFDPGELTGPKCARNALVQCLPDCRRAAILRACSRHRSAPEAQTRVVRLRQASSATPATMRAQLSGSGTASGLVAGCQ